MGLHVIALISGGKDSFFSALKCMELGHRIVALANLYPEVDKRSRPDDGSGAGESSADGADAHSGPGAFDEDEEDLNSFMYQTVGHEVIPLYAEATGLPLYREPIVGRAVQEGRDYASPAENESGDGAEKDETESMTRLLRRICQAHPDADAVCSGAILSTYQRTRVESVAARLGLISLAFCWQIPRLPVEDHHHHHHHHLDRATSAQSYLMDLAANAFDVRIVKVASGGLEEDDYGPLLFANLSDDTTRVRLLRVLGRFTGTPGDRGGSFCDSATGLGEGGEYETLVLNGPPALFRQGAISVADGDWRVVRDSGGTAWVQIRRATVLHRSTSPLRTAATKEVLPLGTMAPEHGARPPRCLVDQRFGDILRSSRSSSSSSSTGGDESNKEMPPVAKDSTSLFPAAAAAAARRHPLMPPPSETLASQLVTWSVIPDSSASAAAAEASIADATQSIVDQVHARLDAAAGGPLSPTRHILRTLVVLRRMADFPAVNAVYATLFRGGEPNPPARVCIASGSSSDNAAVLPEGVDVAVFLSVLLDPQQMLHRAPQLRQGLHVQSRSFWAPANIGPYSQAVSVPLGCLVADNDNDSGSSSSSCCAPVRSSLTSSFAPRIVFIAGQIPLVPATMEMADHETAAVASLGVFEAGPDKHAPASFAFQAVFALQHLWRIAEERGIQWWTSAVVYVPRHERRGDSEMANLLPRKAAQAAHIWRSAHYWPRQDDGRESNSNEDDRDDDDDGNEGGPDLWDRTYDAKYRTYGNGGSIDDDWLLPNWEVLVQEGTTSSITTKKEAPKPVPPLFLAEVEELPRSAAAEWHVQAGFSNLVPGSVRCGVVVGEEGPSSSPSAQPGGGQVHHTVVQIPIDDDDDDDDDGSDEEDENKKATSGRRRSVNRSICQTAQSWPYDSNKKLSAAATWSTATTGSNTGRRIAPDVVYVDLSAVDGSVSALLADGVPVVPCVSLWDDQGVRLAAVAVTTSVIEQEETKLVRR